MTRFCFLFFSFFASCAGLGLLFFPVHAEEARPAPALPHALVALWDETTPEGWASGTTRNEALLLVETRWVFSEEAPTPHALIKALQTGVVDDTLRHRMCFSLRGLNGPKARPAWASAATPSFSQTRSGDALMRRPASSRSTAWIVGDVFLPYPRTAKATDTKSTGDASGFVSYTPFPFPVPNPGTGTAQAPVLDPMPAAVPLPSSLLLLMAALGLFRILKRKTPLLS